MSAYRFRKSLLHKEVHYDLTDAAITASDGRVLDFADITRVRIYAIPGGASAGVRRCVIRAAHGRAMVLASATFVSLGNIEDRSETFDVFVRDMMKRAAAANSKIRFVVGMPLALWGVWILTLAALAVYMPVAAGMLAIAVFGDSGLVLVLVAIAIVPAIAALLFHFLAGMGSDWPRTFDPLGEERRGEAA